MSDIPLRQWSRTLGFRGRRLTKSRRWSVPFRHLREERANWQEDRCRQITKDQTSDEQPTKYDFVEIGCRDPGEVYFAAINQRKMFETRVMLREMESQR